jgi:hypothetical protein
MIAILKIHMSGINTLFLFLFAENKEVHPGSVGVQKE